MVYIDNQAMQTYSGNFLGKSQIKMILSLAIAEKQFKISHFPPKPILDDHPAFSE